MKIKKVLIRLILFIFINIILITFSFCQINNKTISIHTNKKGYNINDTVYLLINNNDTNKIFSIYIDLDYISGDDTLIYIPEQALKQRISFFCIPSQNNNMLELKERINEGGCNFRKFEQFTTIKFYLFYNNKIKLNHLYRFRLFYFEYPDTELKLVKVTCSNPFYFKNK